MADKPTTDVSWDKLPSFETMLRIAFGKHSICDRDHPIYRELLGLKAKKLDQGDED
jgi:hypothetical protein